VLVANTAKEFKKIIDWLTEDSNRAEEIGRKARIFVENNHDNDFIMKGLIEFYKTL